jgi:hypothetical protein
VDGSKDEFDNAPKGTNRLQVPPSCLHSTILVIIVPLLPPPLYLSLPAVMTELMMVLLSSWFEKDNDDEDTAVIAGLQLKLPGTGNSTACRCSSCSCRRCDIPPEEEVCEWPLTSAIVATHLVPKDTSIA